MNGLIYCIIILLSAFIGWAIIRVGRIIIFYPRSPIKILGFSFQGILPKNQQLMVKKISLILSKELISFNSIEQKIINPENIEKLKPEIEVHIDHFLRNKLKEVFPMLAMLVGDKTINQLKGAFITELETLFPTLIKNYINNLKEEIDIEKAITNNIDSFFTKKLESLFNEFAQKKIRKIELVTALFGGIIGIIQVLIFFSIR